jgi:hypothetical protein
MKKIRLIELSSEEIISIEGGKPIGYYMGYAIGFVCGEVTTFLGGIAEAFRQ